MVVNANNTTPSILRTFCEPSDYQATTINNLAVGDLTPCFTEIAIFGILHLFMIVFFSIRIGYLRSSKTRKYKLQNKMIKLFQLVLSVLILFIPWISFGGQIGSQVGTEYSYQGTAPFQLFSIISGSLAWLMCIVAVWMEHDVITKEGDWIHKFLWTCALVADIIKGHQIIVLKIASFTDFFFILFLIHFVSISILFLLAVFYNPLHQGLTQLTQEDTVIEMKQVVKGIKVVPGSDSDPVTTLPECPEYTSNIFSRMTFSWFTPIIKLGNKKALMDDDVWTITSKKSNVILNPKFLEIWDEEKEKRKKGRIIYHSIRRMFGTRLLLSGLGKLGNDLGQFAPPMIMGFLIRFMSEKNDNPDWFGYFLALAMASTMIIGSFSEAQYFQMTMRIGLEIRSVLISFIFQKAILRKDYTTSTGKINNLITTDVEAVKDLFQSIWQCWSIPFRVIVSIVLLWSTVKYGVFSLLLLLIFVPLQKKVLTWQINILKNGYRFTDKRLKYINEIFGNIEIVKCYAWEKSFSEKVTDVRNEELKWFLKGNLLRSINSFLVGAIPVAMIALAFLIFVFSGNKLTAEVAFVSLSYFDIFIFPLMAFPRVVQQIVKANVAVNRMEEFLLQESVDISENPPQEQEKPAISIVDGHFSWDPEAEKPTLSDIQISVPNGALVAIIGTTGCGKSSLISSMFGEIGKIRGKVTVRGKMSYVPQQAWIYNDTIQENILFGLEYDANKYKKTISVSQLKRDLELQPSGDMTEIGERGVNLSGGQKQRVSIARAVYSGSETILFDDPLSALDAHVAEKLFHECIVHELNGKTRILVTNQVQFIANADHIILLDDGKILAQGTYQELWENSNEFKVFVGTNAEEKKEEKNEEDVEEEKENKEEKKEENKKEKNVLIKAEDREKGMIKFQVYSTFIEAFGGIKKFIPLFFAFVLYESFRVISQFWISYWTASLQKPNPRSTFYYVGINIVFSFSSSLCSCASMILMSYRSIDASKALHSDMFNSLLRAPMSFFHSTPLGRIINRFSKDIADLDGPMSLFLSYFINGLFGMIGTIIIIAYSSIYTVAAFVPIGFIFYFVQRYFQNANRELKRLDSVSRSPIYAYFAQCLLGTSSIQVYRAHEQISQNVSMKIDRNSAMALACFSSNRWLAIRLEFLGGLIVFVSSAALIFSKNILSDNQAGLALAAAISMTSRMNMTVRLAALAENAFNSVERISHYTRVEPEAPLKKKDTRPDDSWPTKGVIEFKNVNMRYREGLDLVLKGFSAVIKEKEKVGVVGRTGAGKSSLFKTLYRLVELARDDPQEESFITIDELDISTLGLHDLRKKLSIIPQDPVIFIGTIKSNLDPFNELKPVQIWDALTRAHLADHVKNLPDGLESKVSEGGTNFSVGQRQLLCLARALLRKSRILVLDEATSAVDVHTDNLIQVTIRSEFKECTTLTIAHRLNTIIDSDRIMVLSAGQVIEFDSAANLLKMPDGVFNSMVKSTGTQTSNHLRRIALGEANFNKLLQDQLQESKVMHKPMSKSVLLNRQQTIGQLEGVEYKGKRLNEIKHAFLSLRKAIKEVDTEEFLQEIQESHESTLLWLDEMKYMAKQLSIQIDHKIDSIQPDSNTQERLLNDRAFLVTFHK